MNRILWAGLIVMAVSVFLYLGYLLTTFTRPMLTGVAIIGCLLFIAGAVLAIIEKFKVKSPDTLMAETAEPIHKTTPPRKAKKVA